MVTSRTASRARGRQRQRGARHRPGRGALVLYPGERFRGREIEISRVGGDGHRVHTGVHERTTQTQSLLTAIFGSLPVGEYVVWEDATTEGPVVTVPDGAVAEVRLS